MIRPCSPLCSDALQAIKNTAQGYSNLEYDLDEGKRFTHVEELICKLTGGEAATVVNNNAGAVMLTLAALAGSRSALVSRGELIEIGSSRAPDRNAVDPLVDTRECTNNVFNYDISFYADGRLIQEEPFFSKARGSRWSRLSEDRSSLIEDKPSV